MTTNQKKKTLKEVLPPEFMGCEYRTTRARKFADVEVIEEVDGCKPGRKWPGPQKSVFWWYRLANGKAVGFNENPARGWSFPVISEKEKEPSASENTAEDRTLPTVFQVLADDQTLELVNEITSRGPFMELFDRLDDGESHDLCQHLEDQLTPIVTENQKLKRQVQAIVDLAEKLRSNDGVGLFIAQELENRLKGAQ